MVSDKAPYLRYKQNYSYTDSAKRIDGILKGDRRGAAQQQIADNTAAHSHTEGQNANTKDIHFFTNSLVVGSKNPRVLVLPVGGMGPSLE